MSQSIVLKLRPFYGKQSLSHNLKYGWLSLSHVGTFDLLLFFLQASLRVVKLITTSSFHLTFNIRNFLLSVTTTSTIYGLWIKPQSVHELVQGQFS